MAKKTMADLKNELRALKQSLESEIEQVAVEMANTIKAIAERRIIDKGIKGAKYSDKGLPLFFLEASLLNKKGGAYIKKKKKDAKPAGNWKGIREAQGLQVDHVDLYYSGDMWRNIGVVKVNKDGGVAVAVLGGLTEKAQDKMNWNRDRYNDFIQNHVTKRELKQVQTEAKNRIIEILKKHNVE